VSHFYFLLAVFYLKIFRRLDDRRRNRQTADKQYSFGNVRKPISIHGIIKS